MKPINLKKYQPPYRPTVTVQCKASEERRTQIVRFYWLGLIVKPFTYLQIPTLHRMIQGVIKLQKTHKCLSLLNIHGRRHISFANFSLILPSMGNQQIGFAVFLSKVGPTSSNQCGRAVKAVCAVPRVCPLMQMIWTFKIVSHPLKLGITILKLKFL